MREEGTTHEAQSHELELGTTIALLVLNFVIGLWLLHRPSSAQEAQ